MNSEQIKLISTHIFKSNNDYIAKRSELINEAIAFKSGNIDKPEKTIIATLPLGKEAYFLKPGKETKRKIPNLYDMWPNVGNNEQSDTANWAFERIWEYLLKISIIQQCAFKEILVLLYRLCFFMDHQRNPQGQLRYIPSNEILDFIINIDDFVLKAGFNEKFKTTEIGLLEFLHFIDLLAWNEDVKYHITDGKSDFAENNRKNVGRVNTILTIISAPLLINKFINNIIESSKNNGVIDVKLITSTIQKFTKTRGLCVLSNKELVKNLNPYLEA